MERLPESGHSVDGLMNLKQGIGERVYDILNNLANLPRELVHWVCEWFDFVFWSSLGRKEVTAEDMFYLTGYYAYLPRILTHKLCEWFDFVFWSNLPIPKVTQAPYVPEKNPYRSSDF